MAGIRWVDVSAQILLSITLRWVEGTLTMSLLYPGLTPMVSSPSGGYLVMKLRYFTYYLVAP